MLKELPDGWTIYSQAPTLSALASQEKPTLHFADGAHGELFVWHGKDVRGREFFRLASARRYQPRDGPANWVIARSDDEGRLEDHSMLPMIAAKLVKGRPSNEPRERGMGTYNWARVVASDQRHGTVYEVEYYAQISGEAAQGMLLVLYHDAGGAWHKLANFTGDYWDDTGYVQQNDAQVRWSRDTKVPVEVLQNRRVLEAGN